MKKMWAKDFLKLILVPDDDCRRRGCKIILSTLCIDEYFRMYFYFICLNKQRLFWYIPKIIFFAILVRYTLYTLYKFNYSLIDGVLTKTTFFFL